MRLIDQTIDGFAGMLKDDLQGKDASQVAQMYQGVATDVIDSMTRLEDLIEKNLDGNPVPVIEVSNQAITSPKA